MSAEPQRAVGVRQLTDHGRERKQQLVDAATVLFTERGYAATRVADICRAAGVAKGLFYWYFPTKRDLFVELVRTMRHRLRRAQADALQPDTDAVSQIRQGVVASVRFIVDHASYFSFVEVERSDPSLAEPVSSGRDVYVADVAARIRVGQAEGSITAGDAVLLAHGVVGTVWSYTEAWRRGQLPGTGEDLAAFVGDWVVRALTPDRTAAPPPSHRVSAADLLGG